MSGWQWSGLKNLQSALCHLAFASGVVKTIDDDWKIPADKQDFHVFLLMGQSNMAGGIPGSELTEEDKTPVPGVVIRRGKGWNPAAHPIHLGGKKNGFGLGLPFAIEYMKHHPGVTVGLVPCASGGKRIDLLKKGSKLYRAAINKSKLALEQVVRFVGCHLFRPLSLHGHYALGGIAGAIIDPRRFLCTQLELTL